MRAAWCGCGQTFRILADLRIYIHPEAVLGNPSIEEKKVKKTTFGTKGGAGVREKCRKVHLFINKKFGQYGGGFWA